MNNTVNHVFLKHFIQRYECFRNTWRNKDEQSEKKAA